MKPIDFVNEMRNTAALMGEIKVGRYWVEKNGPRRCVKVAVMLPGARVENHEFETAAEAETAIRASVKDWFGRVGAK